MVSLLVEQVSGAVEGAGAVDAGGEAMKFSVRAQPKPPASEPAHIPQASNTAAARL